MRLFLLLAMIIVTAPTLSARAQDVTSLNDRLNRLERDITYLQRKIYRGETGGDANGAPPPAASSAASQVQFTQIQEEMRQLRGQFEQVQYNNARLSNDLKQLSEDVDYRLQAIEKKLEEAPRAEEELDEEDAPVEDAEVEDEPVTPEDNPAQYQPEGISPSDPKSFVNSSAHYSHAFKLMNDRKFSEAGKSFERFVEKYPKDPLLANAYYWLGESYYVRAKYKEAAEGFRKGFEAAPKGQKAPDNLLKLGMSLGALKRNDQACVVLKQLISKYGNRAPDARTKAQREYGKLKCK